MQLHRMPDVDLQPAVAGHKRAAPAACGEKRLTAYRAGHRRPRARLALENAPHFLDSSDARTTASRSGIRQAHFRSTLLTFVVFAMIVAPASDALAGGFYLLPRGSRPLSRGGAYVAGAEDPHSIWYNPAGLAYSGDQLLLDGTLTLFEASYTRVDSGGNTLPEAYGFHPYLPIPTAAGSFSLDELEHFTFALAVLAPNSALMQWPTEPNAPQRYSLLTLEGSLLLSVAAAAAWRPVEELSLGLAVHVITGSFNARVALSACDGTICAFPEDPEYDAVAQITLPFAYPMFMLGTVIDLDVVRIGITASSPFNLEGSAQVQVRPPSASEFSGSETVNRRDGCTTGDCRSDTRANVLIEFPVQLRVGVEVRPIPELRIELAAVYESWSLQDQITIDPQDVWIENALGGALEYQIGPINIPRQMNDTISVRLGGEGLIADIVSVRAGVSYENSSFPDAYLTALTLDSDKVSISAGVGIDASDEVSIDLVGGYLWMAPRTVTNSMVLQANPIRPPASADSAVPVGNGTYTMGGGYFGLGVRWRLDAGNLRGPGTEPQPRSEAEPEPEPVPGPAAGPQDAAAEPEPTSGEEPPWFLRGRDN